MKLKKLNIPFNKILSLYQNNELKEMKKSIKNSTKNLKKIKNETEIKVIDDFFPLNEINEIFEKSFQKKIKDSELSIIDIPKEIELLNNIIIEKNQKYHNNDTINFNL